MAILVFKNEVIPTAADFDSPLATIDRQQHIGGFSTIYNLFSAMNLPFYIKQWKELRENIRGVVDTQGQYHRESSSYEALNFHEDFVPYYIKFILDKSCLSESQRLEVCAIYQRLLQVIEEICDPSLVLKLEHLPVFSRYHIQEGFHYAGLRSNSENDPDTTHLLDFSKVHQYCQEIYTLFHDHPIGEYIIVFS